MTASAGTRVSRWAWLVACGAPLTADGELVLTAEQAHVLQQLLELSLLPGLGPLPIDIERDADQRLCVDAALRSLAARGILGADEARAPAVHADVAALLRDHATPTVLVTVRRDSPVAHEEQLWSVRPDGVTAWRALTPTDYALARVEGTAIARDVARLVGSAPPITAPHDPVDTLSRHVRDGAWVQTTCSRRDASTTQTSVVTGLVGDDGTAWLLAGDDPGDADVEDRLQSMSARDLLGRLLAIVPGGLDGLQPLLRPLPDALRAPDASHPTTQA